MCTHIDYRIALPTDQYSVDLPSSCPLQKQHFVGVTVYSGGFKGRVQAKCVQKFLSCHAHFWHVNALHDTLIIVVAS